MSISLAAAQERIKRLEGQDEDRFRFASKAKAMEPVNQKLNALRRSSMNSEAEPPVFITGEAGSAPEGLGRIIHAQSRGVSAPWVYVNCAEFERDALEAELFGKEQTPGLLDFADQGSLFLAEITETSQAVQTKILSLITNSTFTRARGNESVRVKVRVLASTTLAPQELKEKASNGTFSSELLNTLNHTRLDLPPLRNRTEDIVPMASQFAKKAMRTQGKRFEGFDPDAEQELTRMPWPGNVKELYFVVERAALAVGRKGKISASDLGLGGGRTTATTGSNAPNLRVVSEVGTEMNYTALKKKWADSFEREYLQVALNRNGGNVSAAAREAKLDRSNFLRLLRRHGIKAQDYRVTEQQPVQETATGTPERGAA